MKLENTKMAIAVMVAFALTLASGNVAQADDAQADFEDDPGVTPLEEVTGTEDLLQVEPGDSSEQVYLPAHGDGLASIEANGLSVAFQQPVVASTETDVSADGTVSYVNDESSYDVHLQAVESADPAVLSDGLRSLIEIQDADAPTEYVYPVHLDEGVEMVVQEDGSVVGFEEGEVALIVPAPWAVDNAGNEVPTSYEVRGNDLVQHVDYASHHEFPIIADPVWFVPLVVAGGRVIGQVAIKAATKAAAKRAAAAQAARAVVKTVKGKITSKAAKRCYKGAAYGSAPSVAITLQQTGNGNWRVRVGNAAFAGVASGVAGCLAANIK